MLVGDILCGEEFDFVVGFKADGVTRLEIGAFTVISLSWPAPLALIRMSLPALSREPAAVALVWVLLLLLFEPPMLILRLMPPTLSAAVASRLSITLPASSVLVAIWLALPLMLVPWPAITAP